jgi:hypothetical protein
MRDFLAAMDRPRSAAERRRLTIQFLAQNTEPAPIDRWQARFHERLRLAST